jgi:hypothetical protein
LIDDFRSLSNLIFSHSLASIFAFDHRPMTTTSDKTPSDNVNKNWNIITKMRDLRARSPYALFIKDNYGEISAKYPSKGILIMITDDMTKDNFRFKIS